MPFVDSEGVRLYYEETGAGTPVIWAHEFAADCRAWEAQVRRFSRDYRCITYNARGYPPSDVPEHDAAYGYEQERDDLARLMDALAIKEAHLVGLSMGAYTGLQVAIKYPERVRSLVFSSGGSGAYKPGREQFLKEARDAAERMMREGMEIVAKSLATGPARIQLLDKDARGWEEFRRHLAEHSALGSALTMRNFQARRPSLFDLEAELCRLDMPVLLAVGDEDDPVLEVNLSLQRTIPGAGLWVQPKTGHAMNLEEPDEYNRRIAQFLTAVEHGGWPRRDREVNALRGYFGSSANGCSAPSAA
ncbi:MAG: alpha/beta hydrolase [Hyphomicrobiales bacterium]|nr:alpha/beta hydrolase [Hyphomicrobiales bacterium]